VARGNSIPGVRARRISDNVPGLPACRASGMSAGPLLLNSPIRSRRPRREQRRVREPAVIWSAPAASARRYALPYLACYLTSFLHTTLERASRGKHVRLLSTGSAPPPAQWRHQGPRKAGLLHVHSPHHSPSRCPYGARLFATAKPDSTPEARQAMLFIGAQKRAPARPASARLESPEADDRRYRSLTVNPLRGGGAGQLHSWLFAHGAFQITF